MRTQQANPGGILAPEEVVGRDKLVGQLWKMLERRSIYITAERRMGKSCIIRDKMGKAPPSDWKLIYIDVSKAVSPLQFIEALLKACRPEMDARKKAKFAFYGLLTKLSGTEFTPGVGIKLPDELGPQWKQLLETLAQDLAILEPRVVLAFDELPLMLDAIKRRKGNTTDEALQGEALIMELLDTLRAVRQENDLRMIYTGSLGLHHVLTILREQGYQNDPINDMTRIDLEPIHEEDATELARRLLEGEEVSSENVQEVAAHLARETDGIAFYIQHIVGDMGLREVRGTTVEVDRCLKARLTDPLDPWSLNYYEDRIDTHYPPEYRAIARAVLDQLAQGQPKTLQELTDGIDPAEIKRDTETVRKVVNLLGLDHYTIIEDTQYSFRSPFIQRIWRSRRGIGE